MRDGQVELDNPIPTSRRRKLIILYNRTIPGTCTLCRPNYIEAYRDETHWAIHSPMAWLDDPYKRCPYLSGPQFALLSVSAVMTTRSIAGLVRAPTVSTLARVLTTRCAVDHTPSR